MGTRAGAKVALATAGLFVITLLGHELAHFVVFQAALVSIEPKAWGPEVRALAPASGPLFTLAILVAVALWGRRQTVRRRLLAFAAICGTASRIAVVAPGTLFFNAANDERTVGRLLEIPPSLLWFLEAVVAIATIMAVAATLDRALLKASAGWIVSGIVAGLICAVTLGRAVGLPI